jgi:hypothetical protein
MTKVWLTLRCQQHGCHDKQLSQEVDTNFSKAMENGAQEFVPSVSNAILRAELRGYKEGIQDADEIVREGGKKGFLALAITGFFLLLLMYGFPILDLIRQHIKC